MSKAEGRVLLPSAVLPSAYDIKLKPDLVRFGFEGEVTISCDASEATNTITLHAKELYIKNATYTPEGGETMEQAQILLDRKMLTVCFTFPEEIQPGKGSLYIEFEGCLNDQMAGFYRSMYTTFEGEKRVMASTQFEAIDARRAFPCWDEPARKATFTLSLTVPRDRIAFSNMPELRRISVPDNMQTIEFAESPIMSTYLLGFVVGEFDFLQATTNGGVAIRCYTPPGKSSQGKFALDAAVKALDFYDMYFEIKYPLPKLDMVAIPEFAAGAMENWGVVTYREVDLLIDEASASPQQKQRVCSVVTHELAHQWFGNLVTMTWWDDLWLNEGFAAWMQNFAADAQYPEWKLWDQFIHSDQMSALNLDALKSSHPIQVPIAHAEEVEEVFDLVSYNKGACLVRMLHAYLGPEAFKKGLQCYLNKHQYSNTETDDLWAAWSEASGKDVPGTMKTWVEHMGCPLVTILSSEESEDGGLTLKVKQEWFLADCSDGGTDVPVWKIPMLNVVPEGTQEMFIMDSAESSFTVPGVAKEGFIKLNAGQHVPMRVSYDATTFERIKLALRMDKMDNPADRVGLVADFFALGRCGKKDMGDVLELCAELKQEMSYTVWAELESNLNALAPVLAAGYKNYTAFEDYVRALIRDAAAKVGWDTKEDDTHLTKMLRAVLIRLAASFPYPEAIEEATKRFVAFRQDPGTPLLPSEFREPVYKIVAKTGGEEAYNALYAVFKRCENHVDKLQVMRALGHTSIPQLKQKTLDWAIKSEDVKKQDCMYPVIGVCSSGAVGINLAWEWFKANFPDLKKKLGNAMGIMGHLITKCAGGFVTADKVKEVEEFFEAHKVDLANSQRKVSQTLEIMHINTKWLETIQTGKMGDDGFFVMILMTMDM